MKVTKAKSLTNLDTVVKSWISECKNDLFGLDIDGKVYWKDLSRLIAEEESELFVLCDENNIYGLLGVRCFGSPLGNQKIASEHYWYVLPEKRGLSALKFLPVVEKWAREKGCSHLIMNASNLASGLHDKTCNLYEKLGMKKFETSYIKRV